MQVIEHFSNDFGSSLTKHIITFAKNNSYKVIHIAYSTFVRNDSQVTHNAIVTFEKL